MNKLSKYKLVFIDTNKLAKKGRMELTGKEAEIINYAFSLNKTGLKYVKV
jgi:hypothetical protein